MGGPRAGERHGNAHFRVLHQRGHPEVGQLQAACRVHDQIGGFEIPMNNLLAMGVLQGATQLQDQGLEVLP